MWSPLQTEYADKVRLLFSDRMSPPLALVDTYGCQQNEADSERLRGMLLAMGFLMTPEEEDADLIVINTCAVREHAQMRVLGNVGALTHVKRRNPHQKIVLCGCMMQQTEAVEKVRQSYRLVDMTFGPPALPRFPELLYELYTQKGRHLHIYDHDHAVHEDLPVLRGQPPKAWVTLMQGCNNFCTYCIVPYARGRERSRNPLAIVDEVRTLAQTGYTELTLLGQNVNSYDGGHGFGFPDMLRTLETLPEPFTLSFMTSHPKDASPALFDTMAACSKVKRHLHLPFQSGSDRILRAMNRGYTRAQYLALIDYAKAAMPDLQLTSDVIVGFPGETEEDFQDTLALMRQVAFDNLFTFIYSPRPGTPAANRDDPTPPGEKRDRMARLLALQQAVKGG